MSGTFDLTSLGEPGRVSVTKLPTLTGSCDVDKSGPRTYPPDVEKSTNADSRQYRPHDSALDPSSITGYICTSFSDSVLQQGAAGLTCSTDMEQIWVSPPTDLGISVGFARTGSERAWPLNGAARFLADGVGKVAVA